MINKYTNTYKVVTIDELIKKHNPDIDIIKGFDVVVDNVDIQLIYHYKYTILNNELIDSAAGSSFVCDIVLFHIPNLDIVAIASGSVEGVIKYKGYFKYNDSKQSLLRTDFDNLSFEYSDISYKIQQFERNIKLENILKAFGV